MSARGCDVCHKRGSACRCGADQRARRAMWEDFMTNDLKYLRELPAAVLTTSTPARTGTLTPQED